MLPVSTLLPFFGISLVLGLAPGPDNIFVLLQSAIRGARSGMVVVLGLCTGLLVHTFVVAIGLGALLVASNLAFTALKSVGALYLVYLAWQAWRAPVGLQSSNAESIDAAHLYRRGLFMNLSNPKVIIFFLAFLPQFVMTERGDVPLQLAVLGIIFIASSLIVFSFIACFSSIGGKLLMRSPRAQHTLNCFASLVFLALAIKLICTHL
ncbi:LysE family translocator [Paraburkholderia sp. C35]|uniref:LysE family translocator n=1 Tax=Paraburkholderia sp. C35 TaxID=2126993 RepID=UPI000D68A39C|nr:LysE family translocator [Paraburkholderia sp. C35]